jgi:hypothetical protein
MQNDNHVVSTTELPDYSEEVNQPQSTAMTISEGPRHESALQAFEQREALFSKVLGAAISATSPKDWVDQDGKPYLQASGAERVGVRFGIQIFGVNQTREDVSDAKGSYYVIKTTGKASFGDASVIEAMGVCTSRDKFFGRSKGNLKAMEDVDLGNIMRKSYTNFEVNAITRLLGIRALTWEELERHGIKRSGANSVSYKKDTTHQTQSQPVSSATVKDGDKKPFWKWTANDGSEWISAITGTHFGASFLESLGMRLGKKEGMYNSKFNDQMLSALEQEYKEAESILVAQKGTV